MATSSKLPGIEIKVRYEQRKFLNRVMRYKHVLVKIQSFMFSAGRVAIQKCPESSLYSIFFHLVLTLLVYFVHRWFPLLLHYTQPIDLAPLFASSLVHHPGLNAKFSSCIEIRECNWNWKLGMLRTVWHHLKETWCMNEDHLEMISMLLWDALTWFLCGSVDGCWLWPRASRIESSHREVVHCVGFQPCDVNQCVISRDAHFANSVRLGVIFPVHDLLGKKKKKKVTFTSTNGRIKLNLDSIMKSEMLFVLYKKREGAIMNNEFFTHRGSITDAHPPTSSSINHPRHIKRALVGHMMTNQGNKFMTTKSVHKTSLNLYFSWRNNIKGENI